MSYVARLALADKNGEIIFALVLSADETKFNLYEAYSNGKYPLVIASANKNSSINVKIEYYTEAEMANIYVDSSAITSSGILYDAKSNSLAYAHCEIKALAAGVLLEDVMADVIYRPYVTVAQRGDTNYESASETVTFDHSLDTNLPSMISGSIYKTWNAGVQIKQMLKKIKGKEEYSSMTRFFL